MDSNMEYMPDGSDLLLGKDPEYILYKALGEINGALKFYLHNSYRSANGRVHVLRRIDDANNIECAITIMEFSLHDSITVALHNDNNIDYVYFTKLKEKNKVTHSIEVGHKDSPDLWKHVLLSTKESFITAGQFVNLCSNVHWMVEKKIITEREHT